VGWKVVHVLAPDAGKARLSTVERRTGGTAIGDVRQKTATVVLTT